MAANKPPIHLSFVEAGCAERVRLHDIPQRHALEIAWQRFEQRYLNPS